MSDIFISCAIEEREKAAKLAALFEQERWSVWWNPYEITPGADYARVIAQEVEGAKVVVMLWSRAARESFFTRVALKDLGRVPVVPVLLEKIELPTVTTLLRTFDLSDWVGDREGLAWHIEVQRLLRYIRTLIATSSPPAAPPVSIEELSLSEIQESARRAMKESGHSRPKDDGRFRGVFISYRRNEAAAYAGRLYDRLAARFGRERVFIDTENVGWGEDFVEAITSAAESCAVMIALVSPRWSRGAGGQLDLDDYVRLEVATALGRKIRVIPIPIQGASMPKPKELPDDLAPLARLNAIPLSDDARWERDVEDLVKTLEKLLNV
jgi:hypothetical protein